MKKKNLIASAITYVAKKTADRGYGYPSPWTVYQPKEPQKKEK